MISDNHLLLKTGIQDHSRDLDKITTFQLEEFNQNIQLLFEDVITYSSIVEFMRNIKLHKDDLIFPYWYGEKSRNRAAIVSALCEAAALDYIGGDVYTRIICSDKAISKSLLHRAGLATPEWVLVERDNDEDLLSTLPYPVIVKPNNENSSIGITEKSIAKDVDEAIGLSRQVRSLFNCAAIAEKFQNGRETCICLIGHKGNVNLCEFGERFSPDIAGFFQNRIFSYELKKIRKVKTEMRCISNEAPSCLFDKAKDLYWRLGDTEMLRIDGRWHDNKFWAIELTPSPLMTTSSDFLGTFINAGYNIKDLIETIIINSVNSIPKRGFNHD